MMRKSEFREMLNDPMSDPTGWRAEELEEFMETMGEDGWICFNRKI